MQVFNTLTRAKEELIPLTPGEFKIYSCGPTVYNYFHIGNARPFIIFDTLRRYLEYLGNKVIFVQNFTDVDDKMIARANEEGVSMAQLGEKFIAAYFEDADALGIARATHHPRATEHIEEIIALVSTLIEKGHAYEVEGDVYFAASSFEPYGKLSAQPMENLELGARIDPGERKREPMDFALWKAQKPGEPAWDSPWGKGRPGWHIECSAMSTKYLGETFDIHCGGQDLIFPHHENEIAQSEAANGKSFARYWMHNGYINVDNRKMSKSLGNFFTVREIAQEFDLQSVRLFMLMSHYRSPINFSRDLIVQAEAALRRLHTARERLSSFPGGSGARCGLQLEAFRNDFIAAMDDDLNTAEGTGVLFELARFCNSSLNEDSALDDIALAKSVFDELMSVLGLKQKAAEAFPAAALDLAKKRNEARAAKDFKLADGLREELLAMGISIEDTAAGPKLKWV